MNVVSEVTPQDVAALQASDSLPIHCLSKGWRFLSHLVTNTNAMQRLSGVPQRRGKRTRQEIRFGPNHYFTAALLQSELREKMFIRPVERVRARLKSATVPDSPPTGSDRGPQ